MIARYTRPAMGALWTAERRYRSWLEVELAAAEEMAALGIVPADLVAACRDFDHTFDAADVARIEEIERTTKHDVIAFLAFLEERIGPAARVLHRGLTSSDVLDTSLAMLLRDACDLLLAGVDRAMDAVRRRALEHKRTPMIGRSHGIHAEATTFGLKLLVWWDELRRGRERLAAARERIRVGKLSGAVGTFAHLPMEVEERALARLGLLPAPASTQIVQRDRHAELFAVLALIGASIEKFAVEIRHLMRTEVREAEEPFGAGQKGSSAMPHKRNPIAAENLTGLARLLRGNALAAMENVALWHERDISHSSVERVIAPDSTCVLDFMLHRFAGLVDGLVVHRERMRANLELTRGLVFSQRVLLALTDKGQERQKAYGMVQRNAMRAWDEGQDFRALLEADPQVRAVLSPDEIASCFDLASELSRVDAIFARVLGA